MAPPSSLPPTGRNSAIPSKIPRLALATRTRQFKECNDKVRLTILPDAEDATIRPYGDESSTSDASDQEANTLRAEVKDVNTDEDGRKHGSGVSILAIGDIPEPGCDTNALKNTGSSSTASHRGWKLSDFDLGPDFGSGSFGSVRLARTKATPHFIFALKMVEKSRMEGREHKLRREIENQGNIRHPNILRLYGYFNDAHHVYIMLKYAKGDTLSKRLFEVGRPSEEQAARWVYQIATALVHIHAKHTIHRDIKCSNILLDMNDNVKIADFGESVHAPSDRRKTKCGTLSYMAPEVLVENPHSSKADIWSFGIVAYKITC